MSQYEPHLEAHSSPTTSSHPETKPGHTSMLQGFFFKVVGMALLFISLVCFASVTLVFRNNPLNAGTLIFCAALIILNVSLLLIGAMSFNYGRRLLLAGTDEVQTLKDARPPVLYLRSFQADRWASMVPLAGPTILSLKTEEEELADLMKTVGPFTAIGQPGDKLPQLGASRIYVDSVDWKVTVERLMKEARVIVLRAGDSEGFWWELGKLVEIKKRPEYVLFLLPFAKAEYEAFRARAETILPCRLPAYKRGLTTSGSLRGLLYFEPDWTAKFVTFKKVGGFKAARSPVATTLKIALHPFFNQLLINLENTPDYQPTTLATEPALQLQNPELAKAIAGRYVNTNNTAEYIELNPDGSFYVSERNVKLGGSFDINNEKLTLRLASGPKQDANIGEDRIKDSEGKEWIKQVGIEIDGEKKRLMDSQPRQAWAGSSDLFKSLQEPESRTLLGFLSSRLLRRVAIALVPLLLVSGYFYYRSPKSVASANWVTYKFSNSGLSVELPCNPTVKQESQPKVHSLTAQGCAFGDLAFHIESVVHDDFGALNGVTAQTALLLYGQAAEKKARSLPGKRFGYYDHQQIAAKPAATKDKYTLSFKYEEGKVPFELEALAAVQGRALYLVAIHYASSEDDATKAMTRICNSVRLP